MSDTELITGYREIVFDIHSLKQRLAWNRRHGLPVMNIPEKIQQRVHELIRFEDLLESIQDRRARNIICFRFVLGMTDRDTADCMGISRVTVNRICSDTLRSMEQRVETAKSVEI